MDRNMLIQQVKAEYARLAEAQADITDLSPGRQGDAYFEALLQKVIHGIEAGDFDRFRSGHEIVQAVANDHEHWGISM